jgi:hypothetical protein
MKPKLGTFVTALSAGTLTTAAWAQDLGRVHFETSCTPQAQEKFDLAWHVERQHNLESR